MTTLRRDGQALTDADLQKLADYAIRLVYCCRNTGIAERFEDVDAFCEATERLLGLPVPSVGRAEDEEGPSEPPAAP